MGFFHCRQAFYYNKEVTTGTEIHAACIGNCLGTCSSIDCSIRVYASSKHYYCTCTVLETVLLVKWQISHPCYLVILSSKIKASYNVMGVEATIFGNLYTYNVL